MRAIGHSERRRRIGLGIQYNAQVFAAAAAAVESLRGRSEEIGEEGGENPLDAIVQCLRVCTHRTGPDRTIRQVINKNRNERVERERE